MRLDLPVAELAWSPAALVADSALFEAFDTTLDFVAPAPAMTLVVAETAEAAVLSPAAAPELAPAGQLAADGSVTWTLDLSISGSRLYRLTPTHVSHN